MDNGEVFALVAAERRRAADMFEEMRDEQWAAAAGGRARAPQPVQR